MSDTLDLHKSRGRPREFDTAAALDAAMALFIERGYAATAISDLGEAMGLTADSIYKAFGDKRGVFVAALERYTSTRDLRFPKAGAVRENLILHTIRNGQADGLTSYV